MADRPVTADNKAPDREVRGFSFALESVVDGSIERLSLRALHRPLYGPICADWLTPDLARRIAGGRRQPLAKAIGLNKPRTAEEGPLKVLDATAGLGRDAYTLAALGAQLTLLERNGTVCALLGNAHTRVLADPTSRTIGERIKIVEAEAAAFLGYPANHGRWDAIYLDPMYPDDGKAALPSKEMQILRDLTGGDADADTLLRSALGAGARRVVVKRPSKAPPLAGIEPTIRHDSTQLRFDVYLK